MDDERMELTDPDHPNAKEAASITARLLLQLHEKRQEEAKNENASMPDHNNEVEDGN